MKDKDILKYWDGIPGLPVATAELEPLIIQFSRDIAQRVVKEEHARACTWDPSFLHRGDYYRTSCGAEYPHTFVGTYCPFCGGRVEIGRASCRERV